jgi:hypothetical protein
MNTLHVIPAPGLLVPMPDVPAGGGRHLPAEGAVVNDTAFWRRRIADGEVSLAEPVEPAPPKTTKGKE